MLHSPDARPGAAGPAFPLPMVDPELSILDLRPLRQAEAKQDPYPFVTASGCVNPMLLPDLRRDFPRLRETGFHPIDAFQPVGAFARLLEELQGPEIAEILSEKLGVDLRPLPRLITVRYVSAAHEGRIHTDSASKVATMLLYLHHGWTSPAGRLRILRDGRNFEPYVEEISPEEGNILAFRRGENSWHGHTPFVGERRVVQMAWLRDASEIERKRKRHGLSRLLKRLFHGSAGG